MPRKTKEQIETDNKDQEKQKNKLKQIIKIINKKQ